MINIIKDCNGKELALGDKVGLPSITGATFELIQHEERGVCLYTYSVGFEAYVSIKEAELYGMCKL